MREIWIRSLSWEDPLEKGKTIHSSILAWRIPWTLSPWGHKESDTTDLLIIIYCFHSSLHRSLLLGNVKPSSVFSIDVIILESRILRIGLDGLYGQFCEVHSHPVQIHLKQYLILFLQMESFTLIVRSMDLLSSMPFFFSWTIWKKPTSPSPISPPLEQLSTWLPQKPFLLCFFIPWAQKKFFFN